jgi:hypothetical protein
MGWLVSTGTFAATDRSPRSAIMSTTSAIMFPGGFRRVRPRPDVRCQSDSGRRAAILEMMLDLLSLGQEYGILGDVRGEVADPLQVPRHEQQLQ